MKRVFLLLMVIMVGIYATSCDEFNFNDIPNDNPTEQPEDENNNEEAIFEVDSKGTYVVDAKGGNVEVEVTTNLDYNVEIPEKAEAWLRVADTRAVRTETLIFELDANDSGDERSATVRLEDSEGKKLKTIKFKQEAAADEDDENEGNEEDDSNSNDGENNDDSDNGNEDDGNGDNGNDDNGEEDTGDDDTQLVVSITLSVEKDVVNVGEALYFTVTDDKGNDVTSSSKIYDMTNDYQEVSNPYTATEEGVIEFYAVYESFSTETIMVTFVSATPEPPVDEEPVTTKFNHRILLTKHTASWCVYCPDMSDKVLAFNDTYPSLVDNYNYVECHSSESYSGTQYEDTAYSYAAAVVAHVQEVGGYPQLSINLKSATIKNYPQSSFISNLKSQFDRLIKSDGADVGISITTTGDTETVAATAVVMAAVEQEYKITAWLLENNIRNGYQNGASKDEHYIYKHAIRDIAGEYSFEDLSGESLGVIKVAESVEKMFEFSISDTAWNHENMEVLIIVSAKDSTNNWEVVNTALCPVNSNVDFEYIK